jgi:outer membrane protein
MLHLSVRSPAVVAVLMLLASGALPHTASSQQAGTEPVPDSLSLSQAIAYAERWRPQYQRVLNDESVADANVRRRQGEYLPNLSLGLNTQSGGSRRYTGQDPFGNPVRLDDPSVYSSSMSNQSISAQLNVFDFGRRESELRAARANRTAVRADVQRERLELRRQVTLRYYAALQAEAGVEIAERQLTFAREQLDLTERKFSVAAADREAVLGARATVASSEGALAQARSDARKARLDLAEVMGAPLSDSFVLADGIPDLSHVQVDEEALVQRALQRNPQILAADAQAVAADRRVSVARSGYLPQLTAGGSFSRSMSSRGGSAFAKIDPLDQNWGVQLQLSVPVFDRFATGQSVAQARADREDRLQEQRMQRLSAERQVRAYVLDVESAKTRLALAREAVQLGTERLELAQQGFQSGSLNFDQYLQVLERLVAYERDELSARATLATAVADLEQVVGEPIADRTP